MLWNRDYTPMVMWVVLLAGIIGLALVRSPATAGVWNAFAVNFDIIFIGLYILWMLMELPVSLKDFGAEHKKTSHLATCQLYGLGQALTIFTALWFPSVWRLPNMAHFLGLAVFLSGGCYRLWAIRTLGRFYSHRVRIRDRHRIVTTGPYRFTRHPAYAGMILANAGVAVYFCNRVTWVVFLFVLAPAIVARIAVEEKMLFELAGYADYAKGKKRLFPVIW